MLKVVKDRNMYTCYTSVECGGGLGWLHVQAFASSFAFTYKVDNGFQVLNHELLELYFSKNTSFQ